MKTIRKLFEQEQEVAKNKIDIAHDINQAVFVDGRISITGAHGIPSLPLEDHALMQFMSILNHRSGYVFMRDAVLPNLPGAADAVLNGLITIGAGNYKNGKPKRVMTRAWIDGTNDDGGSNGVARAFVSSKYTRYDSVDIVGQLNDFVGGVEHTIARGSFIGRDNGVIKFTVANTETDDDGNYGIGAGIRWNEIGSGGIRMFKLIQRNSCDNSIRIYNGSLGNASDNLRHVGSMEDLTYRIKHFMSEALQNEAVQESMRQLAVARTLALPNAAELVANLTRSVVGRAAGEQPILRAVSGMEGELSLFGVVNGLTRAAKYYDGAAAGDELEIAAGSVFGLADEFAKNFGKGMRKINALAKTDWSQVDKEEEIEYA